MKCPYCNKQLEILDRVYKALEFYEPKTVLAHTECCNKLVKMKIIHHFEASKYEGDKTQDDWGVTI